MQSGKVVVRLVSLVAIVALGGYAWYSQRHATPANLPVQGAPDPEASAVIVETARAAPHPMPDQVSAVGTLRSNESAVLRPEVSGRISAIHFVEGRPVARGVPLLELDASMQRAELQQARANLELAEAHFQRTVDLFQRKFVSQSARDEAASKLEIARAQVRLAQARLERMRILAPFDGTVGIRNVSVGDFVKDGEALINIEDISTLKVDFRLPERYLPLIRPGLTLEVRSDTLPDERFSATVAAIDPLIDAQGRAVVVRARLANADGRLRPGMFVRVLVTLAQRPEVVSVPEEALVAAPGDVQYVFQVVDGKARRVEVRTGARRDTRVEIVDGLKNGDVVVTAGQLKLREGVPVRAVAPAPVN
ncbi:MAG: efflux RND transporter periplasmic adaptor subunit [Rhodocyclales bacterium]|nr:efflux RND transporter periplasmic adaptor subunit [Rhodocyclales bacterium]